MNKSDFATGYAVGYNDGLNNSSEIKSDKWVRPSDWPEMPEPTDNQIVMLMSTQWLTNPHEQFTVYAYKYGEAEINFDGTTSVSVNWGDGCDDIINLPNDVSIVTPIHYFYDNTTNSGWHSGPILDNGAHVFIITITLPDNAYFYSNGYNNEKLEVYVGKNVKFFNTVMSAWKMLEHIKFFGWQPSDKTHQIIGSCFSLQYVETTEPLIYLPNNAFSSCCALKEIDLSQCEEIGERGLYETAITKIESEKLKTLGASALQRCFHLKKLNTPNLTSIGKYAFMACVNIESITHADDWTYLKGAFADLYKWYDNPEMSHPQIE